MEIGGQNVSRRSLPTNFQRKITSAGLSFASRWQMRLMSWFGARTWPEAELCHYYWLREDSLPFIM